MEIKLLTTTNKKKIRKNLESFVQRINCDKYNEKDFDIALEQFALETNKYIAEEMTKYVAAAGKLSRSPGSVFDVLELCENKTFEENCKFATMVAGMGHDSITDHDYLLFALKDVTPVIEQIIIAERFSSFTIKSRREVNFKEVGFITPDFHDKDGNLIKNNEQVKEEYREYMQSLFNTYGDFVDQGVNVEDARFVLPYCYHSNIIMGIDAHTAKDLIIRLTKGKLSRITEVKEFANHIYDIIKERSPYIAGTIEKAENKPFDAVEDYLNSLMPNNYNQYKIIDKVKLINYSNDIDNNILISSIMRIYQLDYAKAKELYDDLSKKDINFSKVLMKKIANESTSCLELTQVNFQFQIPLSFAVLTHLTRHRTTALLIPDFFPVIDLTQYKIPPRIEKQFKEQFEKVFIKNNEVFNKFKNEYKIREEDLIYWTLSGNMVNVECNTNGKTLKHILGLRMCSKAQWETQAMANAMFDEVKKIAPIFATILGPCCVTKGYCPEGKESCGKINQIKKD